MDYSNNRVVIELRNVKREFLVGEEIVHALRGVSFKIHEGEFVTIMGTSGSGKSTLLNQLGCLDTPSSGEYLLDGVPVRQMSRNQRAILRNRKIGFVFQNYNLLPKTTSVENVELPLMYNPAISAKERFDRSVKALQRVGLGDRLYHKSNQMSGGQMQRLTIARAFLKSSSILLLDEPTSALDVKTEEAINRIIETRKNNQTVIIIAHRLSTIRNADDIIVLHKGKVAERGCHFELLGKEGLYSKLYNNECETGIE